MGWARVAHACPLDSHTLCSILDGPERVGIPTWEARKQGQAVGEPEQRVRERVSSVATSQQGAGTTTSPWAGHRA